MPTPDEPWQPAELVFDWGTTLPYVLLVQQDRREPDDAPVILGNCWASGACRIGQRGDTFTPLMDDVSDDVTTKGAWALNEALGRPAPIEGYFVSLS